MTGKRSRNPYTYSNESTLRNYVYRPSKRARWWNAQNVVPQPARHHLYNTFWARNLVRRGDSAAYRYRLYKKRGATRLRRWNARVKYLSSLRRKYLGRWVSRYRRAKAAIAPVRNHPIWRQPY